MASSLGLARILSRRAYSALQSQKAAQEKEVREQLLAAVLVATH